MAKKRVAKRPVSQDKVAEEQLMIKMYRDNLKSPREIADALGTYPNKVRRVLQASKSVEIRDRSSAQKNALATGKSEHPTEGKERSLEERIAISSGLSNYWENMSEADYEERVAGAQQRWAAIPEGKKKKMRDLAMKAIRKAGKEGSKLEKIVYDALIEAGHSVERHNENLIPQEKLEIDLYIRKLRVIIEIDGPSHFLPIWGEKQLQNQMRFDMRKNGVILNRGFVMIRVKDLNSWLSLKRQHDLINTITTCLESIKQKFPEEADRYIEIEV